MNTGFLCALKSKLYTILVVMCVRRLLGMVTSYTLGGFVPVLLLVALIIFVI